MSASRQPMIVFHSAYPQRLAGSNRSMLETALGLKDNGWDVLVAFSGTGPAVEAFSRHVPTIVLPIPQSLNQFGGVTLQQGGWARIKTAFEWAICNVRYARILRQFKGSAFHARDIRSVLVCGLAARMAGMPVVLHIRGRLPRMPAVLKKFAESISNRIVVVAAAIKDEVSDHNQHKVRVIYNPISARAASHTCVQRRDEGTVLTTFCSIVRNKGLHVLVEACEILRSRGEDSGLKVRIVGEPVDTRYANELASSSMCQTGLIEFVGWTDSPADLYGSSHIVVLPSFSEGFPRTVLEAMWFGCAVIASAVGGVPEQIDNLDSGILVSPGSSQELADAIALLHRDSALRERLGQRAAEVVRSRFQTPRIISEFEQLYQEIGVTRQRLRQLPARAS